VTAYFSSNIT